jgi:hypothetical protein
VFLVELANLLETLLLEVFLEDLLVLGFKETYFLNHTVWRHSRQIMSIEWLTHNAKGT